MIYVFGEYELDTDLYELRRGKKRCSVEPQVFELLRFLVVNRSRMVTKQELLEELWPDRFVSEAALSSRLRDARRAIGDDGRRQEVIRTTHGRGFRFVAEVDERQAFDQGPQVSDEYQKPETRYALSGTVNIAYQVIGSGPVDVVFVMGWVSHLEMFWAEPSFARFLRRLSTFSRVILFDKRGTGLSDRVPLTNLPNLEQRMDDVRAVMQAAGSRRAFLMGVSEGAPMCLLFAATYPEKAAGAILIGGYARRLKAPDYPWGDEKEVRERFIQYVGREWGGPVGLEARAPTRSSDPLFRDWWATYLRMGASPGAVMTLMRMNDQIDVRQVLGTIQVPTLIIHRTEDRSVDVGHARYMAERIPGVTYVELPGDDHLPFVGNQEEILAPIERFVATATPEERKEHVLSTAVAAHVTSSQLAWAEQQVEWFEGIRRGGGVPVVATFDGPARAIRCALSIVGAGGAAAVHTGECEVGTGAGGPAIAAAREMLGHSGPGEVVVSATTRSLVAGGGLMFRQRSGREGDQLYVASIAP